MQTNQPDYLSYLLRLWRIEREETGVTDKSTPAWRASLECAQTGEVVQFRDLGALIGYLLVQTGTLHNLNIYVNIHMHFHETDKEAQT
jgi:hypothetical protein